MGRREATPTEKVPCVGLHRAAVQASSTDPPVDATSLTACCQWATAFARSLPVLAIFPLDLHPVTLHTLFVDHDHTNSLAPHTTVRSPPAVLPIPLRSVSHIPLRNAEGVAASSRPGEVLSPVDSHGPSSSASPPQPAGPTIVAGGTASSRQRTSQPPESPADLPPGGRTTSPQAPVPPLHDPLPEGGGRGWATSVSDLESTATSPFSPSPNSIPLLLEHLSCSSLSLLQVAHAHNTSLDALTTWMTRPDIAERLDELHHIAAQRARLVAAQHLAAATEALASIVHTGMSRAESAPLDPTNPRQLALRLRQRESIRRAATTILRISTYCPRRWLARVPTPDPAPTAHAAGVQVNSRGSPRSGTPGTPVPLNDSLARGAQRPVSEPDGPTSPPATSTAARCGVTPDTLSVGVASRRPTATHLRGFAAPSVPRLSGFAESRVPQARALFSAAGAPSPLPRHNRAPP